MKSYICDTCERSFTTSYGLTRHRNTTKKHASHQLSKNTENIYLCEVCKKEFDKVEEFTIHQKSCSYRSKKELEEASRSVLQSTTLAFVKVHDAVKVAFKEVNKAIHPLYQCESQNRTRKEKLECALDSITFYKYTQTLSMMVYSVMSLFCVMRL